jgi:hypothetical protein
MAKGRLDLKRIQRASRSVEGVSEDGLSVQVFKITSSVGGWLKYEP